VLDLFCEFTLFFFFPLLLSVEGYYVGRPINYDDQKSQPPPPTSQAAAEQVNAQVPGACITDPSLLPGFPVPFLFLSTCLNLVPFGKGRLLRRPCGRQESRRRRPELRCCRSDEQTIGLPCQLVKYYYTLLNN
jgi:hypothetical protein